MKKRILAIMLCICIAIPMLTLSASAAATNIEVTDVEFYSNGDISDLTIEFGWNTASANDSFYLQLIIFQYTRLWISHNAYVQFDYLGNYDPHHT